MAMLNNQTVSHILSLQIIHLFVDDLRTVGADPGRVGPCCDLMESTSEVSVYLGQAWFFDSFIHGVYMGTIYIYIHIISYHIILYYIMYIYIYIRVYREVHLF